MSSIMKGITDEQSVTKTQPEVQVPGYGTMPLDMLKRHVQSLSKDFNDSIQKGEFLKAAYRTEQFYNALMALAKAMKQQSKVDETHSTGTTVGSAGIGGGAGLGIEKSPIEKVIEKPLGEGELPPKAGFNKKPHKVGPGTSKDDYEYKSYIPRDRKEKGEEWAIARDVRNVNSKLGKKKPKELDTGFYKNYLSNRPVREGEVVSLQARKTPLVVAGSPFDWNVYDLRNNKMVANVLGGDRSDSKLYEIRIKSSGMTPTTRMIPTYVLTAGAHDNPPYKAYELVAPEGGFGKIEKSPGPGGTTKLRPDQDDMLRHLFKNLGGGKYYGYDLVLVEEGLDQWELIEKALGAKIMEIDDAIELGYTDWDPEDSSSIVYVGNKVDESLPTSPGGMGQSYRKFRPKVAGTNEEQAPMFTPEEKMVNANDPRSDGWRLYKLKTEGSKDEVDEVSNFLALRQKDDEFKKIFGTTPLYKEGDKIVTKFSDQTPNVKGVVIDFDPKTKKTLIKADDGETYFVHAQNLSKIKKESSIMKGLQAENESSKGK